jgi:competence protein ComEA
VSQTKLNRYRLIAVVLLITVIITTGAIAWTRYRPSRPIEIVVPPEQDISGNIYINGAVTNPGVYQYSGGDTIGALLQSAGGVTANGNADNLELNIPPTAGATSTGQKININSAEEWLLDALPGIGPAKAQAIIDYRQKNGFFRSVDELTKVEGISTTLLEQIRPFITVSD